jgi:probable addiction module antidote protein
MAKTRTRPYDTAEYLETGEDMALYLEAALEDGDPRVVAAALGDIARAHGMTQIAKATGLSRESLYKALSPEGNPELATVLKVVQSLGLQLQARAVGPVSPPAVVVSSKLRKARAHKLPSA